MNDTTKEYNGKNTYTNNVVCNALRLGGSWNLVTLNSRAGGGGERGERGEKQTKNIFWGIVLLGRYSLGRGCPTGCPFKFEMQDFKHFHLSRTHSPFSPFQI